MGIGALASALAIQRNKKSLQEQSPMQIRVNPNVARAGSGASFFWTLFVAQ
jgi:hypothetical protein